jgi:phenylalanyl-tRNA synthetase beta chain
LNCPAHPYLDCAFAINLKEETLGFGGQIKRTVLNAYEIKYSDVFYAELSIENLLYQSTSPCFYTSLPKFPPLKIDISFLVDRAIEYRQIKEFIKQQKIEYLTNFELIDVFYSQELGETKKSYTLRLNFGHPSKSLEKKEIQNSVETLYHLLEQKFNIIKRS